ncbi:MAG: Bug family tripartite tricarboxylate transporter substrate binding protein [Beijerinckiaceae bacterium]
MNLRRAGICSLFIVLTAAVADRAYADPVADFYKGRNVDFIVGAAAGGGFDQTARPLAPFLSKYIPGNPNVVVRNMPGGAGVIMTNYLVSAAAADGTVIGMGTGNIPYEPRLNMLSPDGKNIRYDPRKLAWIGTPVREPQVSYVWHGTPVKTWQDLRTQKVRFGATAASGDNAIFPAMANKLLKLNSEVITGYRGVAEILLAMERGELEANNSAYSTLGVAKPDWRRDNKVRYVMQFGVERISELSDVPTLYELVNDPEDKRMLRFFFLKFEMHRPIYAPPNVPPERLAALRKAFDAATRDPDFLAIADKMGLMIRPLDGAGVAALVDEIMTTPQPVVDRLKRTLDDAGIK